MIRAWTTILVSENHRSAKGCTERAARMRNRPDLRGGSAERLQPRKGGERFAVLLPDGITRICQDDIEAHEAITWMARAPDPFPLCHVAPLRWPWVRPPVA